MSNLAAELLRMRAQLGRHPTAREGVAEVEDNPSAYPGFYARLEWDDTRAAQQRREDQFRETVRSISVRYVDDDGATRSTRGFISVRREGDPSDREYVPAAEVASDPRMRMLALADAQREWTALFRKYEHLQEFVRLVRDTVGEVELV